MKTVVGVVLLLVSSKALAEQVSIAVAANFTHTMEVLVPLFEKKTGHKTLVSYGSTGKLFAQIYHDAPFEVFLSADRQRPEKIERLGFSVPDTRFTYAQGKLALWSKNGELFNDGLQYLTMSSYSRLSVGNPKTVPYGLAAKELMQKLAIWENNKHKLVRGENIAQAFQFVASENVNVGLVALSLIKQQPDKGSLWIVPAGYHAPIHQQAVLLKKGQDNPAATAFLAFLQSSVAQQIIQQHGYDVINAETAAL